MSEEAVTAPEPVEAPPVVETEASPLEALKSGVDEATPAKVEPVVDEPKGATGAEATAGATGATAAAEPTPEEKQGAEIKAKDDAEIKSLNLKGKSAERFRELAGEARKAAELSKTVETLKPLADEAEQYREIIRDTGANADQLGTMFQIVKSINSRDPVLMGKAFDRLCEQTAWLGKQLGRSFAGVDPVTDHKDLNDAVTAGDMTKERAQEIARLRAVETRSTAQSAEKQNEDSFRQAYTVAMAEINGPLNARLTADPHFKAKLEALKPAIEVMKETAHPSKWPALIEAAFKKIPNPTTAPVTAQPIRPTGHSAPLRPEPKAPIDVFRRAIEEGSGAPQEY